MKKIVVYCDTQWAIGRIYKDVEKYLLNEFEFTYYDWADYNPNYIIEIMDNFDICITNLVNIGHFINLTSNQLKKMIFACHGYPEFENLKNFEFPKEPSYAITSKSIISLFPENIQHVLYHTYNGVELSNFNYIKRSGKLEKMGWCGSPRLECKRSNWCITISGKTKLDLMFATSLSYEELKKWYNKIDVLLINSGPEYWRETGPLPAFEAIASGVLVIGTKVGNFAEIPGPKYETVEEAVAILLDLKKNQDKVIEIMNEQYACIQNNWIYEILANQWRNMYHQNKIYY